MRATPLINHKLILAQLTLLFLLFFVTIVFGPLQDQALTLPYEDEAPSPEHSANTTHSPVGDQEGESDQEGEGKKASDEHLLPLSERAPGRLSHEMVKKDGVYWGRLENGWRARLSLDVNFQRIAKRHLKRNRLPFGAMVLMEVDTGRIIGLSQYYDQQHPISQLVNLKDDVHIALQALAPSAGGFRMATYMALLEEGLSPMREMSYPSLPHILRISERDLKERSHDARSSLSQAFVEDNLSFLAQASYKHLKSTDLKRTALSLGFDRRIPFFDLPYELSSAYISTHEVDKVKTALGIENTKMSVLHAAMMTAMIANGGRLVRPQLVDFIENKEGKVHRAPQLEPIKHSGVKKSTARRMRTLLRRAMVVDKQVSSVFADWPSSLSDQKVAGQKSLRTDRKGIYKAYSWFMGFLPADRPRWAFAVMVLNQERFYARSFHIAHRVLKEYLSVKAKD